MKKINVYCMNEAGKIVCGLVTNNESTAAAYAARKSAKGLLTVKTVRQ